MITFTDKNGIEKNGVLVHQYVAFEGGMRYIIEVDGVQYRCVEKDGKYIELRV